MRPKSDVLGFTWRHIVHPSPAEGPESTEHPLARDGGCHSQRVEYAEDVGAGSPQTSQVRCESSAARSMRAAAAPCADGVV